MSSVVRKNVVFFLLLWKSLSVLMKQVSIWVGNLLPDVHSLKIQLFCHVTCFLCFLPNSCSLALCLVWKTMGTSLILESVGLMLSYLVRKPKIISKRSREVSRSVGGVAGLKSGVGK